MVTGSVIEETDALPFNSIVHNTIARVIANNTRVAGEKWILGVCQAMNVR